jgi:AcrR family transcriptional regulator
MTTRIATATTQTPAVSTKGKRTRGEIIDAAKSLFYERGYTRTSFSDIVEQTGIRRGNIYHYFKTKEEILDAVIRQHASDYRALLALWDQQTTDPKERLHSFVQMLSSNRENLMRYGCPIGTLNTELSKDAIELHAGARVLFDILVEWLTTQFAALGSGEQARGQALHLLGRCEGISVVGHVYNDPELIDSEISMLTNWIDRF